MADEAQKLSTWIGIAAGVAAIVSAVVYYQSTRSGSNSGYSGGFPIRRQIAQRRRDRTLGYVQSKRKFFGYFGASSAQGAGAAAGAIPSISQLGNARLQTPTVVTNQGASTTPVSGGGAAATAPWRVRSYPRHLRASV